MTAEDDLLREVGGHVGTLTIHRPEKRNTLSAGILIRIHLALKEWAENSEVRVAVITGSGDKAFSAGYDIGTIPTDISPEMAEIIRNHNPISLAMESVATFPLPTVAMMNGYAFGAGLNLALCCDFRIAADHASVSMPPAKLGLVYHPEGIRQFVEVVGMARTREIFLTGRRYTGPELLEMGLVGRLVPAERLREEVYGLAAELAANAPLSLKGTKRI
ncbi:enoyl-CoA hydratase/isomerase family protein, partial [bacterium]|nr:enoyl-CoA hydratase/isomerase family protein [bacterium]